MRFIDAVMRSPYILADGGLETRVAFETDIPVDPETGVALLAGDEPGRGVLEHIYGQYLDVGRRHGVPMHVGTPTFRAGPERLRRAGLHGPDALARTIGDCFGLVARLRDGLGDYGARVFIAGVVGPRGDAYRPAEAPGELESHAYHRDQVRALVGAGVDLLYAPTFPAAGEALGVAAAMAETGLPYVISPIIDAGGRLLDGTPLAELIARIDRAVTPRPAYYTVSCVHPAVLRDALRADERLRALAGDRLLGIKANASTLSPEERVALDHLDAEAPDRLADEIVSMREDYGLRVLGGCCGTDHRHIEALADRLARRGR